MEVGIVSTLEKHIADAKGKPKMRAMLTKHLKETKRHAQGVKKALEALGGTHPVVKEGVSKLANLAAGLFTSAVSDTLVKNAIADFATEHFEIACYQCLIATAEELDEPEISGICRSILREEMTMAKWLEGQMKTINADYLATLEEDDEDEQKEGKEAGNDAKARGRKGRGRAGRQMSRSPAEAAKVRSGRARGGRARTGSSR